MRKVMMMVYISLGRSLKRKTGYSRHLKRQEVESDQRGDVGDGDKRKQTMEKAGPGNIYRKDRRSIERCPDIQERTQPQTRYAALILGCSAGNPGTSVKALWLMEFQTQPRWGESQGTRRGRLHWKPSRPRIEDGDCDGAVPRTATSPIGAR
jgi:hypothetical protein